MKNINKEVKDIQKFAREVSNMRFDDPQSKTAEDTFWKMVDDLDAKAEGLVGKHVQFGVADGSAHYIIVKEGKRMVSVEQLPIFDNWHFQGVYDGKIQRGIVERYVRYEEGMKKLFVKKN